MSEGWRSGSRCADALGVCRFLLASGGADEGLHFVRQPDPALDLLVALRLHRLAASI